MVGLGLSGLLYSILIDAGSGEHCWVQGITRSTRASCEDEKKETIREDDDSQPSLVCAGHDEITLQPARRQYQRIPPGPSVTKSRRSQTFGPPCRQRDD
ncbi:hypothetical protein KCU81_g311, partial [Aureobasidium melanogenum]